jgi:hypothetical protein
VERSTGGKVLGMGKEPMKLGALATRPESVAPDWTSTTWIEEGLSAASSPV